MFGFRYGVGLEPVAVDPERVIGRLRAGLRDLQDVWQPILDEADLACLSQLANGEPEAFRFPDDLWVRVIYAFARAYRHRVIERSQLVRSILPLYMGRVASWVIETWSSDAAAVDQRIERLRERFEAGKPLFRLGWNGVEEGEQRGIRFWRRVEQVWQQFQAQTLVLLPKVMGSGVVLLLGLLFAARALVLLSVALALAGFQWAVRSGSRTARAVWVLGGAAVALSHYVQYFVVVGVFISYACLARTARPIPRKALRSGCASASRVGRRLCPADTDVVAASSDTLMD